MAGGVAPERDVVNGDREAPPSACPLCGAPPAPRAAECAGCGVIFAKYAEKRERELRAAREALERPAVPPPARARLTARGAAMLAVLGWMLALALYYAVAKPGDGARGGTSAGSGTKAVLRDPDTGALLRVEVFDARARPAPVPEREAPVEDSDEFETAAEAAASRVETEAE